MEVEEKNYKFWFFFHEEIWFHLSNFWSIDQIWIFYYNVSGYNADKIAKIYVNGIVRINGVPIYIVLDTGT